MMDVAKVRMQGKTVLVTGATAGIGEVAARELARMGAQVVLVSRDPSRCQATAGRVQAAIPGALVDWIAADLSTKAGVEQAAAQFLAGHARLDVLLNNAGAIFMSRQASREGVEMNFALNHLAYFYLTHLLLDTLKATAVEAGEARIINVSSAAHQGAKLDFGDLQHTHGYNGMNAYGQSKLMNLLFTYELARRLAGTGVTANALHPGFVASRFAMNNGGIVSLGMRLMHLVARSPEKGAETSIYLAASPEVAGVTGKYFVDCRAVQSSPASYNEADARRLWELSAQTLGVEA